MPSKIYNDGKLSGPQLESVVYACQSHEIFLPNKDRRGFFIGVGKGRIIAGIILENIISKREKIIWFSASNDLILDAKRDLDDIGVASDFSGKLLTGVFSWDDLTKKNNILLNLKMSAIKQMEMESKIQNLAKLYLIFNLDYRTQGLFMLVLLLHLNVETKHACCLARYKPCHFKSNATFSIQLGPDFSMESWIDLK